MRRIMKTAGVSIIVSCLVWTCWGFGQAHAAGPSNVACAGEIEWQVVPEAEITQFECMLGDQKGTPSLLFTVGVKNVTDKPLRYRVNVFMLDTDKAVGHLVPSKGKPPVVEAGKTETVKMPSIGTTEMSKKMLVVVKTLSE